VVVFEPEGSTYVKKKKKKIELTKKKEKKEQRNSPLNPFLKV
jgi:hypothetical protein